VSPRYAAGARRIFLCGGSILAALFAPEVRADEPSTATFALVIGANVSVDKDLAPLKYADDDAARSFDMFRLLGANTTLLARLDDNTRRLHPQAAAEAHEPKKADFDSAMAKLASDVAQASERGLEPTVYVVYAGHGNVEGGRGYVTLEDSRLTGPDLARALAKVPAKRIHLVVDACSSYFLAYSRGAGGARRAVTSFATDASLISDPRIGLLLSTSSARESHEWDSFQAGVFSHEVRSGLYGAADADGDGVVTYREIAAFVSRANATIPNEKFRPDVHTRPPSGGEALVDLRRARGRRLEIDGTHAGHYYLEDARGVRLADLHNARGAMLYLVRPPPLSPGGGAVYLRRTEDDRELRLPPLGDVISVGELADEPPRIAARGAAHEAFSGLFSLPFDESVVRAFREPVLAPERPEPTPSPDSPAPGTRRVVGLAVAGGGLALVGTGLAFAVSAGSAGNLPSNASQSEAQSANDRISRDNTLAALLLGTGLVALAGGATLYFWPSARATKVSVVPALGGGFVTAGGHF
jgi:hypothetical protein